MTTWILVTDGARARLFSTELPEDKWTVIQEFEHPEGRQSSSEIRPSGAPGRMQQGKSAGGRRTAFEPRTTPRAASDERFAEELSKFLEHASSTREFDKLVLVAEPHWMGILQAALGHQTAKQVQSVVHKDLVGLEVVELRERLVGAVFPGAAAP